MQADYVLKIILELWLHPPEFTAFVEEHEVGRGDVAVGDEGLIVSGLHLALHKVSEIFNLFVELVSLIQLEWLFLGELIQFLLVLKVFLLDFSLSFLWRFLFLLVSSHQELGKHVLHIHSTINLHAPVVPLADHPLIVVLILVLLWLLLDSKQILFILSLLVLKDIELHKFPLKFADPGLAHVLVDNPLLVPQPIVLNLVSRGLLRLAIGETRGIISVVFAEIYENVPGNELHGLLSLDEGNLGLSGHLLLPLELLVLSEPWWFYLECLVLGIPEVGAYEIRVFSKGE